MTTQYQLEVPVDRELALKKVVEAIRDGRNNGGISTNGSTKQRSPEFAETLMWVRALEVLLAAGGVIFWPEESATDRNRKGYASIFEYVAGEMHDPNASLKECFENVRLYSDEYKMGFTYARKKLPFMLFMVPYPGTTGVLRVITVFPEWRLDENSPTVSEIESMRAAKQYEGQAASSVARLAGIHGPEETEAQLMRITANILKRSTAQLAQQQKQLIYIKKEDGGVFD